MTPPPTSTTTTATSESTFFVEQEEVFHLINVLSSSSSSWTADEALSKLRSILDKYLECPTLLDPYLETIVQKLSFPARGIVHGLFLSQSTARKDEDSSSDVSDIMECKK